MTIRHRPRSTGLAQLVDQALGQQPGGLDLAGLERGLGPDPPGGGGEPDVADLLEDPQRPAGVDVGPAGVELHGVVGPQGADDGLVPAVVDLAGQAHAALEGGVGLVGLAPDGGQGALGGMGQRPLVGRRRFRGERGLGRHELLLGPLEAAGEDLEVGGVDEGQAGGPAVGAVERRRRAVEGQQRASPRRRRSRRTSRRPGWPAPGPRPGRRRDRARRPVARPATRRPGRR